VPGGRDREATFVFLLRRTRTRDRGKHLQVLMEEIEEELVSTLVLGLDAGVLQIGATWKSAPTMRRYQNWACLPRSHPAVKLVGEPLNDVLNRELALVLGQGVLVFVS